MVLVFVSRDATLVTEAIECMAIVEVPRDLTQFTKSVYIPTLSCIISPPKASTVGKHILL